MQGVQILRNEAYIEVRRNDEGCSTTHQMDFLRSRHLLKNQIMDDGPEGFDFFIVPSRVNAVG